MDNGSVFRAYDVSTIPMLVVIDRSGKVRQMHTGNMREGELKEAIEELL